MELQEFKNKIIHIVENLESVYMESYKYMSSKTIIHTQRYVTVSDFVFYYLGVINNKEFYIGQDNYLYIKVTGWCFNKCLQTFCDSNFLNDELKNILNGVTLFLYVQQIREKCRTLNQIKNL